MSPPEDNEERIYTILETVRSRLPTADYATVRELLGEGEPDLALEILCHQLHAAKIKIPAAMRDELVEFGRGCGAADDALAMLSGLVSCDSPT